MIAWMAAAVGHDTSGIFGCPLPHAPQERGAGIELIQRHELVGSVGLGNRAGSANDRRYSRRLE
jgi:hypothetical protein